MKQLAGKIALAAGASRGAGRGIARALGDAGATVYVVARTSKSGAKPPDGAPGTVEDTAEEVSTRGGIGIPIPADLADRTQCEKVFERIEKEQGRLDVMTCSAWAANVMPEWSRPFWKLSDCLWDDLLATLGACWLASVYAARLMQRQRRGLIIHVTDNTHEDPSADRGQILHDAGHEFLNRLIRCMSREGKRHGVTVVGLNPGFMRTERVLMNMTSDAIKRQFRFDLSESPEYIGRAVAALAADPAVDKRTGELLWAAELATHYGFTDIDGTVVPLFDPKAPEKPFPV
jgi:NAD(P)-dependent dehydrogenase (short-subunit alcohol dehydrogenase family)